MLCYLEIQFGRIFLVFRIHSVCKSFQIGKDNLMNLDIDLLLVLINSVSPFFLAFTSAFLFFCPTLSYNSLSFYFWGFSAT